MKQVIVGAGFAGLSTACHLARRGVKDIVVIEREQGPGVFASGRNAGLLRQSSADEALVPMLRRGARAARRLLRPIAGALQPAGSLILGGSVARLRAGPRAKVLESSDIVRGLRGPALFDPEDAIVDPHALLRVYEQQARRRGVEICYGEALEDVAVRGGVVREVVTSRRTIPARGLVVAAGAWAGEVAARAGSTAIEIEILRRHLFRGHLDGRDCSDWPFVWHEDKGVYFRPEGNGLLLSPCDVEPHPARDPDCDPTMRDILAEKLLASFSGMGTWRLGPGWACLRTFTKDHRFLIGHDPSVQGLFWVAALGGHGLTTSWAVGHLAADVLLGAREPGAFDPGRFAK